MNRWGWGMMNKHWRKVDLLLPSPSPPLQPSCFPYSSATSSLSISATYPIGSKYHCFPSFRCTWASQPSEVTALPSCNCLSPILPSCSLTPSTVDSSPKSTCQLELHPHFCSRILLFISFDLLSKEILPVDSPKLPASFPLGLFSPILNKWPTFSFIYIKSRGQICKSEYFSPLLHSTSQF